MAKIHGGEILVRVLRAAQIDTLFGLEGGHIDLIIHAARDAGFRQIDVRHEAVAGYAADAYIRTSGMPAACVTTAGPGFANVITAIVSSYLDRIPVLHVAGAVPLGEAETNALQGDFDQVAMVRPVTRWAERVTSVEMIAPLACAAIRAMFAGAPGPAFLEIPIDVLFSEIEEDAVEIPSLAPVLVRPAPGPVELGRALSLLADARRPVILAGSGALLAQCSEQLQQFAELASIPVFTNIKALGILPGKHPLACGSFTNLARSPLEPDVILILGARNGMFMGGPTHTVLPADAKIIHVDVDFREIGRMHPADVPIVADCRETLSAMLGEEVVWPARADWIARAQTAGDWHRERYGHALADEELPLHPYRVAAMIAEYIDDRTVIVQDGGDTGGWAEINVSEKIPGPGKHLAIGYLGNLGMHQGLAIAAQCAHPDHKVICLTGDGAAGFQLQEFDTMVRHNLPIITIVFNNLAWGMSYEFQIRQEHGLSWVELEDNLRYDLVCEACGGHGEFVQTAAELKPALERALASARPACINIMCRSVASPKTEAFMQAEGVDDIILPYYQNLKRR